MGLGNDPVYSAPSEGWATPVTHAKRIQARRYKLPCAQISKSRLMLGGQPSLHKTCPIGNSNRDDFVVEIIP